MNELQTLYSVSVCRVGSDYYYFYHYGCQSLSSSIKSENLFFNLVLSPPEIKILYYMTVFHSDSDSIGRL